MNPWLTVGAIVLFIAVIALLLVLIWMLSIERRVTVMESKLTHLPTHGDLQGIRGDIAELSSEVAAQREQSEGIARNVRMIHEHLLKGD